MTRLDEIRAATKEPLPPVIEAGMIELIDDRQWLLEQVDRLREVGHRLTHSEGSGAYMRAFDDLTTALTTMEADE